MSSLLVRALLVLGLAGPVRAQEAATNTSAAVSARWADAQRSVEHAEALFASGNYEAALIEFSRSYELLAGHPRQYVVLNNIAACHMRLFRYDQALQYYERYLAEGGPEAEDRATVSTSLETLRGLLATVQVQANVRGDVWVDNRRVGEVPIALHVPAGYHLIEVRATLHESARREVTLVAGSSVRLSLELLPLSSYRGLDPTYAWIATGVTVALAGGAGVLGANTLSARGTGLEHARASMGLQTRETQDDASRIRDRALATDVVLGAAVVCGIASLFLFLLSDREPSPRQSPAVRKNVDGTWSVATR